ncbi:MAG: F0F1 ATP synthase subunit B [Bacteroidaceae bacterium]|nr:F0F1 ATP synthase subunit B [Bacteroidaceae bacterium]
MDLLIPETGTIIWMLLAAGIVFFILMKWGFPMLTDMVDKRNDYIEKSLKAAKEANDRLAGIQAECDELLRETRQEQARIIKEANERRDGIIAEAETKARESAGKIVEDARSQIREERDEALRGIRRQVAEISVRIAEKVILKELSDRDGQTEMIDRMIDEVEAAERK